LSCRTDSSSTGIDSIIVDADRLNYFIFDLLWLNGHDLTALPLIERKRLLGVLLTDPPPNIHYLEHDEGEAEAFFRQMQTKHTEGMITKRKNSVYSAGTRSRDWLKIKTGHRQEMVICGYMPSDKEQRGFKSLLCGVYEGEKLVYSGKVGTGFTRKSMAEIRKKFDSLQTDTIEIDNFSGNGSVRRVEPQLICEVGFSGWTKDGLMRHPRFISLRREKDPEEIGFERAVEPVRSRGRLQLTNLDKVFWPQTGYSKGDALAYYRDVASIILPYIKNRPQSLHRMPDGIDGQSFFQKNVKDLVPSWVETTSVKSSSGKETDYLLRQDTDTLLYTVNLGCIELTPWNSMLPDLEHPDYMVFDLDPVEVSFATLVEVALRFKKLFDTMQMESFCKTSGSRGLHIYLPIEPHHSHNQVQRFVKEIGAHINRGLPETTSLRRDPAARRGKVYLDYLQNGRGKTMASVYSLRPQPGAPVSAPLKWSELTPGLDPADFNLQNMWRRLDRYGDLWSDFYQNRADLEKVLADTTIPIR